MSFLFGLRDQVSQVKIFVKMDYVVGLGLDVSDHVSLALRFGSSFGRVFDILKRESFLVQTDKVYFL